MSARLLLDNFDLIATSPGGIAKLKETILTLAMQGRLVPQDESDEPAAILLERIRSEKQQLIDQGKLKKEKPLPPITAEEQPYDLPTGWEWVRFQNVIDVRDGTHDTPKYVSDGMPLVTSKNLINGRIDLTNIQYISLEDHIKISERSGVNSGDILFAMIGSIGNPAIVEDDTCFSIKNVALFKPMYSNYNYNKYLFHYLNHVQSILRHLSAGGVQSFVSLSVLRNFAFPLPPLAEQQRIVAKVEELFAACDDLTKEHNRQQERRQAYAVSALHHLGDAPGETFAHYRDQVLADLATILATPADVKQLRQTILTLAMQGRLVPQEESDEPAAILLERIRSEKQQLIAQGKLKKEKPLPSITEEDKPYDLPIGWEWVRLGEVAVKITDGTHHSPPNTVNGEYKYVTAKNIKPYGIDLSDITYVTASVHNLIYERCNPEPGDILYIKDGATTGIVAVNNLEEPFSMLSSVALIKCSVFTKNTYLLSALRSPYFYELMRNDMTGVAITRVTLSKLQYAAIPLPPLAEQHRIVAKIEELFAVCDELEVALARSADRQAGLTASILHAVSSL